MNTDEYIKEIEAENEILRSILEKCGITKDNISEFEEMGAAHAIKANEVFDLFMRLNKYDE